MISGCLSYAFLSCRLSWHDRQRPSDLESGRCRDMIHKGRTCGDHSETSSAADHWMNEWSLMRAPQRDRAALTSQKEHTKNEANEHDLPLVRQARA
jgi:hypothetical protein